VLSDLRVLDDDDESGPETGSLGRPSDVLEFVAGFLVTFEVSELDAETFRLRPADGGSLVMAVLSDEGPPEISARRSPIGMVLMKPRLIVAAQMINALLVMDAVQSDARSKAG